MDAVITDNIYIGGEVKNALTLSSRVPSGREALILPAGKKIVFVRLGANAFYGVPSFTATAFQEGPINHYIEIVGIMGREKHPYPVIVTYDDPTPGINKVYTLHNNLTEVSFSSFGSGSGGNFLLELAFGAPKVNSTLTPHADFSTRKFILHNDGSADEHISYLEAAY
jgi:hypothetical protein